MIYSDGYWDDVRTVCEHIPKIAELNNKRILITGATGMICSSVVEILEYLNREFNAGIKILLAGRSEERVRERFPESFHFSYLSYDATKPFHMDADADYIIHGASNANPAVFANEPVETLLGNVVGINSLLELARAKNARLLYISSSEVYGNKDGRHPYSENDYGFVDILNSRACYPNGKRTAETLCAAYGAEYGVDTVVVRPGHIYGPSITESDTRASAQFTRSVLNGENIVMKSNGNQLRSYCYTLDCASAILTVLINGEKGNAYNISNKNSIVTIREFAERLAEYMDKKIVFENPSDKEKKGYNMMMNSSLDSHKLENLGWSAVFNLQEGIKHMIDVMGTENERKDI
jgi:nucleoside-diphosphate-sugar epimerase